tara:strand:+ start:2175 stop:3035 length:861 start_codon:yes stop_codon:yes gene_type:complete
MADDLKLVKELRDKTGAGFLDCKEALGNNDGDIDNAIDYLRKKGLAKASKKSTREANEGAVGFFQNTKKCALIKVNSETDFAAKGDTFLDFIDYLGKILIDLDKLDPDLDTFLNTQVESKTIKEIVDEMIAKIGENIVISEVRVFNINKSNMSFYVHNSYRKNIGKIISIIKYTANTNDETTQNFAKNLCMHIAALKPEAIDEKNLDQEIINKELNIQKELIASSGKPENVIEKILDGKMKKYYSEVTLLNQNFVLDPDKTVQDIINSEHKNNNFEIKMFNFLTLS